MNTSATYVPAKGPEDFYAYRLGLQVQAYGGAIIVAFGIVGKHNTDHQVMLWASNAVHEVTENRTHQKFGLSCTL